jgi:hypothetical protein
LKRIAYLEYQLDLLKRRYGLDAGDPTTLHEQSARAAQAFLIVYSARGRILRIELDPEANTR